MGAPAVDKALSRDTRNAGITYGAASLHGRTMTGLMRSCDRCRRTISRGLPAPGRPGRSIYLGRRDPTDARAL
jgi:hypothetical protein